MEPCPICTTKNESVLTKHSSLVIGTHSLFPSGIDSWEGKSEPCSLRKHLSFMDTICESWIQELQIHLLPPCPGKSWHVTCLLYASVSELLNWWQVIWISDLLWVWKNGCESDMSPQASAGCSVVRENCFRAGVMRLAAFQKGQEKGSDPISYACIQGVGGYESMNVAGMRSRK